MSTPLKDGEKPRYSPRQVGQSVEWDRVFDGGNEQPPEPDLVDFNKLEKEFNRERLNDIAVLMRALTYGEMMEFSQAMWKISDGFEINEITLPAVLHRWAVSHGRDPEHAKTTDQETATLPPSGRRTESMGRES